jgi:hypothetical protein
MGFRVEQALEMGKPVPDWYEEKPELVQGDEFYLSAFWVLNTSRTVSDAKTINCIPWRDIALFAEFYKLEDSLKELFVEVMLAMDREYINYHSRKITSSQMLDKVSVK